jgi:hypothetical protein
MRALFILTILSLISYAKSAVTPKAKPLLSTIRGKEMIHSEKRIFPTCIDCDHLCFDVEDDEDIYRCELAVHMLSGEPADAMTFRMRPHELDEYIVSEKYLEHPCGKEGVYWEPILDTHEGTTVYYIGEKRD